MASTRYERLARTEKINKAKLSDLASGQIEEMVLARELLESFDFVTEAHLNTTAYLDYRYKTPYERTENFMRTYQKWYAKQQEQRRGEVGRWIKRTNLSMCSDRAFTCFWRARQHADLLGVPYDRYMISVMGRASEIGTTELPSPNQLYGDDLAPYVEEDLAPLRKSGTIELIPRDCDPRFLVENHMGDPVQRAALDAIEAEIRRAGKAKHADGLYYYMRQRRVIDEAEARRRFDDEVVDEVLSRPASSFERAYEPLELPCMTAPGCFGCHQSTEPACAECPFAVQCVERAGKVHALVLERHGTLDVRGLRIREGNNERKQRERDRKRAGMTMTLQEEKRILRELGDPKLKEKRLKAKERRDKRKQQELEASKPGIGTSKLEPEQPEPRPQG
ncbi:hypothetical protein [Lysobacter terrae]